MLKNFHPGFIFILIGLFAAMGNSKTRKMILACCPFLALISILSTDVGTVKSFCFLGHWDISYLYVDRLSWVFATTFCVMGVISAIFSCHNKSPLEAFSSMTYVGASLGVILAHDWISFIFFWELEAVASLFLIWNDPRPKSRGAGTRYILMHTISGNLVLFGVIAKLSEKDFYVHNLLGGPHDFAFWAILLGCCINAAVVPFHTWLTDAYPLSTVTGSVFMNSGTSKVAVYALIRLFGGTELLIYAGVFMALYAALYAVMENDMLKLLSYHIVSQVGYLVCAAGIGTVLAIDAAVAHAISNILYKSLLFMCCNAIIYATGVRKINQLGGVAKKYPLIAICFAIGAFSISGMPLFNGFVTKLMVIAAAEEAHLMTIAILLELASIGTFLSIAFKMLYFIFLAPDKGIAQETRPIESNMNVAMIMVAVICVIIGLFPQMTLYQFLPSFAHGYEPYTMIKVTNQYIMFFVAIIPFMMFLPKMEPHTATSLDFDWFYRKPIKSCVTGITRMCFGLCRGLGQAWGVGVHMVMNVCSNPMMFIDAKPFHVKKRYQPENYRTSIADTIMIILTVLFICIFYFRTSY